MVGQRTTPRPRTWPRSPTSSSQSDWDSRDESLVEEPLMLQPQRPFSPGGDPRERERNIRPGRQSDGRGEGEPARALRDGFDELRKLQQERAGEYRPRERPEKPAPPAVLPVEPQAPRFCRARDRRQLLGAARRGEAGEFHSIR